jgi:hypothetical protein
MGKFAWMFAVAALGLGLGCASTGDNQDDATSEGALAGGPVHSLEEAQKVVSTFFARAEGIESGDYEGMVTRELLAADRAYDATDPAPGPGLFRCDQDRPMEFTVDGGVRVGNEGVFTVRYTFDVDRKNFAFRSFMVRLTDLKISFSECSSFSGSGYKKGVGGPCVPGGRYCGGDKVSGSNDVLYSCLTESSGSEIQYCPNGCEVRPGDDDRCKP